MHKWAINGLSVMALARTLEAGTQTKVKEAVEIMADEIEVHHHQYGLSKWHNSRHKQPITEFVKLIR